MALTRPCHELIDALWAGSPTLAPFLSADTRLTYNGRPVSTETFLARAVHELRGGLPDLRVRVRQSLCGTQTCALRLTCTGTHADTLFDIPATGRDVTLTGAMWIHWTTPERAAAIDLQWNRANFLRVLTDARQRLEASALGTGPRK